MVCVGLWTNLSASALQSSEKTSGWSLRWNQPRYRYLGEGGPDCSNPPLSCDYLRLGWCQPAEMGWTLLYCEALWRECDWSSGWSHLHQAPGFAIVSPAIIKCVSRPGLSGDDGSNESWINSTLCCCCVDYTPVSFHSARVSVCHCVWGFHTFREQFGSSVRKDA